MEMTSTMAMEGMWRTTPFFPKEGLPTMVIGTQGPRGGVDRLAAIEWSKDFMVPNVGSTGIAPTIVANQLSDNVARCFDPDHVEVDVFAFREDVTTLHSNVAPSIVCHAQNTSV